jgi:hypothetical protein
MTIYKQTLAQFFNTLEEKKELILPLDAEKEFVDNCINKNLLFNYPNESLEILALLTLPNFQSAMHNLSCEYKEVIMEIIALSYNVLDKDVKQIIKNRIHYFNKHDQLKTLSLEKIDNLALNYFLETEFFDNSLNLNTYLGHTQTILKKLSQGSIMPELFKVYYEKELLENSISKKTNINSILKI